MAITQCPNGHYYDEKKFDRCPHCERGLGNIHDTDAFQQTVAMPGFSNSNGVITLDRDFDNALNESVTRTVSLFMKNGNANPIAGWLVCTAGENKGKSFELHIGKNFVGRSMRSDVVINDPQVSRENHFSVIYDPRSKSFYVASGTSMVYFNGKLLEQPQLMKEDDAIEIGSSKFVFIPFCKEGRDWDG